MSQPNDSTPRAWRERADGTTAINVIRADVEKIIETNATKNWVLGLIGTASVIVVGAAYFVSNTAAGDAKNVAAQVRQQTADDVRQVRQETSVKVERIETKVDAIYKLLIEQKPRAVVRAEADQRMGE